MTHKLLLVFAILLTCGYYVYTVMQACSDRVDLCYDLHQAVLAGTADAPYRYRLLPVVITQAVAFDDSETGILVAYLSAHILTFTALYIGLYKWLREWVEPSRAMLGVFLLAVVYPLAFRRYFLSYGATIEVTLLCWGLWILEQIGKGISRG